MWPDRPAQQDADERFELLCLVLERGIALHTGSSHRLMLNYRISDTHRSRRFPRVQPRGDSSYRIPESWLRPSELVLYFDRLDRHSIPRLGHISTTSGRFDPIDYVLVQAMNECENLLPLPVIKLVSLTGLHCEDNRVCLPLHELDFARLQTADAFLSDHIRTALAEKMQQLVNLSRPWIKAAISEQAARACLRNQTFTLSGMLRMPERYPLPYQASHYG